MISRGKVRTAVDLAFRKREKETIREKALRPAILEEEEGAAGDIDKEKKVKVY